MEKKKRMKKEREREKSNRLEVTWNMRSCSRKKYRPTIVPVKCPRNPLATGFPLAAFRSLLRREPRDFSSSGGTDVINDLRIGNPWNENREHHARIPATCACDRLRICEGRRMNLRAHELLPIPRSIHKKKSSFPPWNDHCTFHVSHPFLDIRVPSLAGWSMITRQLLSIYLKESILMLRILIQSFVLLPSIKNFVLRLDLYIYIYISCLLSSVNQGSRT